MYRLRTRYLSTLIVPINYFATSVQEGGSDMSSQRPRLLIRALQCLTRHTVKGRQSTHTCCGSMDIISLHSGLPRFSNGPGLISRGFSCTADHDDISEIPSMNGPVSHCRLVSCQPSQCVTGPSRFHGIIFRSDRLPTVTMLQVKGMLFPLYPA